MKDRVSSMQDCASLIDYLGFLGADGENVVGVADVAGGAGAEQEYLNLNKFRVCAEASADLPREGRRCGGGGAEIRPSPRLHR